MAKSKKAKKKVQAKSKKRTAPKKEAKRKSAPKKKAENFVVWFEIPVTDIHRAAQFYSKVFDVQLEVMDMGESKGAMFDADMGIASGALIQSNENKPSNVGSMVYLNGGQDLSVPLKRVVEAGGKVVQEKIEIGEYGFIAIFEDSEGNHVALHSMS